MTAIRRDQSVTRANAGIIEWDHKFDLLKINPLAVWTKKEVWKYIVDHEVPFNPLYDNGYASIGCTHCTTRLRLTKMNAPEDGGDSKRKNAACTLRYKIT